MGKKNRTKTLTNKPDGYIGQKNRTDKSVKKIGQINWTNNQTGNRKKKIEQKNSTNKSEKKNRTNCLICCAEFFPVFFFLRYFVRCFD